jgi:hypothetical protein
MQRSLEDAESLPRSRETATGAGNGGLRIGCTMDGDGETRIEVLTLRDFV